MLNVPNNEEEIGTALAAKLLGISQRRVVQLCDEDVLREGRDWWRINGRGHYHIRRAAVRALKDFSAEPAIPERQLSIQRATLRA